VEVARNLPMPLEFDGACKEIQQMGQYICGWEADAAHDYAVQVLKVVAAADNLVHQDGLQPTTTYHWRIDAASMWRGSPDAHKVCGLARSLISVGFDLSEPICARNVSQQYQGLKFGDGQKRGLALRIAWCALRKICFQLQHQSSQHPNMKKIFLSLAKVPTIIPTVDEANNTQGSLIQQALRQNTKAVMTLPMNTIEWARLIIAASVPEGDGQPDDVLACNSFEARASIARKLLNAMNHVVNGYKAKLDEAAVDMAPAAKRQRRGRKAVPSSSTAAKAAAITNALPDEHDSLQIGALRTTALKNILSHATAKSFKMMEQHLEFAGNYKYSALSDAVLASKAIWPGSPPPTEHCPSDSALTAARASLQFSKNMVPKQLSFQQLDHVSPLSVAEHEALLCKAMTIFEDECFHLSDLALRSKLRPDVAQYHDYRLVCVHWIRSIETCARADLSEADFKEVMKAVCFGDALDSQVKAVMVPQFPIIFHMAMLPDLKASMPEDAHPCQESLIADAEKQVWLAKLAEFETKLKADQALMQMVKTGSEHLADHLDWLRHTKRLEEASKASELVQEYISRFFIKVEIDVWEDFAGVYSMNLAAAKQLPTFSIDAAATEPSIKSYSLVVLDFNVPNARDALTIKKLIAAVGNLVKTLDISKTIVFAFTATRPKEDTLNEDPLEDESLLVKLMRQAGFKVSQRVRMALNPPNDEASAGAWDFWQDGRIFFHYEDAAEVSENEWYTHSELCRTTRVGDIPCTLQNADLHHMVPFDAEDRDIAVFKCNDRVRAAQRGPEVFKAVLGAFATRSKLLKANQEWLGPGCVLNIIDVHPHTGDKAMSVLAGSIARSWPCTVRHILVSLPTRRGPLSVDYTIRRVAAHCSRKWMAKEMQLHVYTALPSGAVQSHVVQPANLANDGDLDVERLKEIPGAFEAYRGLRNLDLKVCEVKAGGDIVISLSIASEFSTAPPSIKSQFATLETEMNEVYKQILKGLWKDHQVPSSEAASTPNEGQPMLDPRPEADPHQAATLPEFNSLEELESKVKIVHKCKSFDDRAVTILEDDQGHFYLYAADDNCTMSPGKRIGGIGSGKVQAGDPDEDALASVEFQLPNGDKTLIEVLMSGGAEGDDDAKKEKVKVGSLYMVVKDLQKMNGGSAITIAGHGKLEVAPGLIH
jgi:hypothetical protein